MGSFNFFMRFCGVPRRMPIMAVSQAKMQNQKRSISDVGCQIELLQPGERVWFTAKAELAFRTPRRFASNLRNLGADRSWSACATAPLSKNVLRQ
jgi:hypothetical protein